MKLNHSQGIAGENQALDFLISHGCQFIQRNWHCRFGEIDLIVNDNNILVFVEVRYRKNQQFGGAAYSITPSKLNKLQRSVEYYLSQFPTDMPCRLDAVLISHSSINWIKNITG